MQTLNDFSRSLIALKPARTLIAVIEMSLSSWLVAGIVPGIERQPLKKIAVDESALLRLLYRWREEAEKAGCRIERIVVAFEAGRDGFWLARWLKARSIEAHVIHAASVAVSREHRRAKTDRLDTELLKRAFLGWLRGEHDHCKVVAIPTLKGRGCQTPQPRAREPHRRAKSDCQPKAALGADSEEKREPASDINTALVDRLKALDPNRRIREADITSDAL